MIVRKERAVELWADFLEEFDGRKRAFPSFGIAGRIHDTAHRDLAKFGRALSTKIPYCRFELFEGMRTLFAPAGNLSWLAEADFDLETRYLAGRILSPKEEGGNIGALAQEWEMEGLASDPKFCEGLVYDDEPHSRFYHILDALDSSNNTETLENAGVALEKWGRTFLPAYKKSVNSAFCSPSGYDHSWEYNLGDLAKNLPAQTLPHLENFVGDVFKKLQPSDMAYDLSFGCDEYFVWQVIRSGNVKMVGSFLDFCDGMVEGIEESSLDNLPLRQTQEAVSVVQGHLQILTGDLPEVIKVKGPLCERIDALLTKIQAKKAVLNIWEDVCDLGNNVHSAQAGALGSLSGPDRSLLYGTLAGILRELREREASEVEKELKV